MNKSQEFWFMSVSRNRLPLLSAELFVVLWNETKSFKSMALFQTDSQYCPGYAFCNVIITATLNFWDEQFVIGKRSEPSSDKLGGEIFISSRTLVCLSLYINCTYGVTTNTMPTRTSVRTLTLIPDIAQRKPNNNRN